MSVQDVAGPGAGSEVVWAAGPPSWWPHHDVGTPLFASWEWLSTIGSLQSKGEHGWVRVGGPDAWGALRSTWVTATSTRRSLDPYHWAYEQTAYRTGIADPQPPSRPREAWFPSMVSVLPGLDTYMMGTDAADSGCAVKLLAALIAEAQRRGAATVALGFVQPSEIGLMAGAELMGFQRITMATLATLALPGDRSKDPWAHHSSKQRANMRRTRRLLHEAGVQVDVVARPLEQLDTLVALRCDHLRSHGRHPDAEQERRHIRTLLQRFGDRCTVIVAAAGYEIRAFSLFLRDVDIVHAYMTGRRDLGDNKDLYFDVNYYKPAELFNEQNIAAISYGYGTEEAKRLRGCHLEVVPGYVLHLEH